jgi:hypothetical protein
MTDIGGKSAMHSWRAAKCPDSRFLRQVNSTRKALGECVGDGALVENKAPPHLLAGDLPI